MIKITLEIELQFNGAEGLEEPEAEAVATSLVNEITALVEGDPDEVLDFGSDSEFENVDVTATKWEDLP